MKMSNQLRLISRSEAKAKGLLFYFTGVPCKHGHISTRYASSKHCVKCIQLYDRQWKRQNKERVAFNFRQRRLKNPEKFREDVRRWRKNNPEKHAYLNRKYARKRYYQNPNKTAEWDRLRQWRQSNPDKVRAYRVKRRARNKMAEGRFFGYDIKNILKLQKNRCAFFCDCGKSFTENKYHVDHIVPLAKKGTNWPKNIQLLCASCNRRKNAADPLEYAQRMGRLV